MAGGRLQRKDLQALPLAENSASTTAGVHMEDKGQVSLCLT